MSSRTLLDPKLDIVFKMLFGHPDNRALLVSLLSAVLSPPSPIRTVRVESEPLKGAVDNKEIALDLHVDFEDGQQVNVEMQTEPRPARRERALYYWARMYGGQLGRGAGYHELRRSVVVLILGFRELAGPRFHSRFRVLEVHDQEELSDQLEIHVLELPKLEHVAQSDEPKLVTWGKFFNAASEAEFQELAMKDPDIRQAKAALERLSTDPEARLLAEMRERALISYHLDLSKARKEGRAEGFADGEAKGEAKGKAGLLMALLRRRFRDLSPTVTARIEHASEAQLLEWGLRVLEAKSLDDVFDDS